MRVLIVADMEGVSGIAHLAECEPDSPAYQNGVRLFADEVDVLTGAAFANGASSVSVIDWHLGGGNLRPELLDSRARVVGEDLSVGYDAAVLSGFHAMRGNTRGFISHTMYRELGMTVQVDGRDVGELWLLSRWVGSHGIPVILVTGDAAAIGEAESDVPGAPGIAVKTARSDAEADVVPTADAHAALASQLGSALRSPGLWRTYAAEPPIRFRLWFDGSSRLSPASELSWRRDDDGWLAGEASQPRELIELIDAAGLASTR